MVKQDEIIAFKSKKSLKTLLERYARSVGLTPSVICRLALEEYLQRRTEQRIKPLIISKD